MPAKSNFLRNKVLDSLLGITAYVPPPTLYFALYTAAPTAAGGGTEVAGGAYARVAITNNPANFAAAVAGAKSNASAILFPQATALWGNVVAGGVFDAQTGGNLLWFAPLTNARTIQSGDTFSIPINSAVFSEL